MYEREAVVGHLRLGLLPERRVESVFAKFNYVWNALAPRLPDEGHTENTASYYQEEIKAVVASTAQIRYVRNGDIDEFFALFAEADAHPIGPDAAGDELRARPSRSPGAG
ncbi:hypothetical protein ACFXKI_45040 [Streptomyces mirabilis]|uniref:hypothetical protein n=1 Tax=Streptomyces mirabilis TaxID=68239 RepID=UPI0036A6DC9A